MPAATGDNLTLLQLARITGGELRGRNIEFSALSIDSRSLRHDELFVALRGPNFDGHAFIEAAHKRGASALLVEHRVDSTLPQVVVSDTHKALGELAAAWRMRYQIPLIAVTGSNGKTTVKEMLSSILSAHGRGHDGVLATRGNLNNDIGVPLTLMCINSGHRFAVIEMGANHHGEIRYLTNLARPTVALVNNAGPAHLEGFGDVAGVAKAKGEIFEGLQPDGVAIINADDRYANVWRELCHDKAIKTFGISEASDVSASDLQRTKDGCYRFRLNVDSDSVVIALPLPGRHNVMNALAASAAAIAAGASLQAVREGLQSLQSVGGRLQIKQGDNGVTVIDDTYNANPASLQAALEVLIGSGDGEKILVLGDMGELGDLAEGLHRQMGEQARTAGVDRLFTLGSLAQHAAPPFGAAANHFTTQDALINALQQTLVNRRQAVTVLVKGSRSMQMERVVNALTAGRLAPGGVTRDVVQARAVGAGG